MKYDVSRIVPGKQFLVEGTSYIGEPRSHTAMFITKKVENLLLSLKSVHECLIFAETGMSVPDELEKRHAFSFSKNPQLSYARFAHQFEEERLSEERKIRYILSPQGYYYSESAVIQEDSYIEPGCLIGHGVKIGRNARIFAGTIIHHAVIGDNFISNEHAVIGANGFNMAEDEEGNKFRIPSLGNVLIGDNVEIGAHDNISCGSSGDTIIDDNVKLDALVHIGHDVHLHKNVEVTAGGILGGFVDAGEHAYIGINAVVRNRINIGEYTTVGMGATVTKSVPAGITVVGNPAKEFSKKRIS